MRDDYGDIVRLLRIAAEPGATRATPGGLLLEAAQAIEELSIYRDASTTRIRAMRGQVAALVESLERLTPGTLARAVAETADLRKRMRPAMASETR